MKKRQQKTLWKRHVKIFFFLLAAILVISLSFRLVNLVRNSLFDGQHRFSIIFDAGNVSILTIEPESRQAAIIGIPDHIRVKAPYGGEGEYQIGKIYQLGSFEGRGGELLRDTVGFMFGVPVDGWLTLGIQNSSQSVRALARTEFRVQNSREIFSPKNIFTLLKNWLEGNIDTNLTAIDIIRISWALTGINQAELKEVSLLEYGGLTEEELADGTKIARVSQNVLDSLVKDHLLDREFLDEGWSVSIVNGTGIDGLGSSFARILTNSGINVISVTTAGDAIGESVVETSPSKSQTYTVRKLQQLFKLSLKETTLIKEDVRIIIGQDLPAARLPAGQGRQDLWK